MSVIQLLHGTDHIIEVPDIHIGNPHNDYGMGFYCTRVDEMAREWACKKNTDGFVNSYDFDTEGLKVLNLLDGTHTVLNWMALLLQFRTFKLDSEVAVDARDYLIGHYSIDLTGYDVVIGYRADDSYFQYAPPSRFVEISEKARKAIEETILEHSMKYQEVITWSTDGFFRETKEKVAYRKSEGCAVVEMECSALAACADFRGATWGMILYTADSLADVDKYDERNWGGNAYEYALTLCLDAVIKL